MDDVICNKFANLNNEDFKDKMVCCNCCNSEILSKNIKYCSCCGKPLAIIGLPKSAQVSIPKDYQGKSKGEVSLKATIYNAGYVPLNISFDTTSLPDIVVIKPENAILQADNPGILHLLKEDGNFSYIHENIDDYLPLSCKQEFEIKLSNQALDIAEKNGLEIPINTNAVISNQSNLDVLKRPYLFVSLPSSYYSDEDSEDNSAKQTSESIKINEELNYNITKYDKNSIPQTDIFKLRYTNNSTYPVKLTINIEQSELIPQVTQIICVCHGRQEGYIPIKFPFNSFLSLEKYEIKLNIIPKFDNQKGPADPIERIIKIKNTCSTRFEVNKRNEIEFENLIVSQQISYAKIDVDIFNNKEDFKITDIEFSNDYVRILNYNELKNRIIRKTDEKIEVKLVFSTRWVNPDKYYFFEGKNKLSGRIILHTSLLSNLNINIDWKVKVQGLPPKSIRDNDILALDFGTVNSCIAIYDSKKDRDNVEIVNINREANTGSNMGIVPSALAFFDKDTFIVGQKAQDELKDNPDNVVVSIKRCITGENREFFYEEYTPVKIASLMMEQMILKAVARLGRYPKHVVLTIPANFWGPLREKIKEAFEKAWGECKPDLIDEPTAAAINYMICPEAKSKFDNKESNILVFDFGGGTLDVSILNINKTNPNETIIQPLIARGDNELGGIDLDFALIQYIISKKFDKDSFEYKALYNNKESFKDYMKDYSNRLAGKVRQARATLSIKSREIKEKLSEEDKVEDIFESFDEEGKEKENKIEITRDDFEKAIDNRMQRAKKFVLNCIKAANLEAKDINYLLLTGQSSRVPAVKKILKEILPSPTEFIDNHEIKTCVAKGAAWTSYHRRLASNFKINSLEKTSYRYGYITSRFPDEVFNELIDNGIPFKDAIGEADIDVIESLQIVQHEGGKEDDVFSDRKEAGVSLIGTADLSNIEPQNGKYHLKVWFDLDSAKIMLEVNNKPVEIGYKQSEGSNIYI